MSLKEYERKRRFEDTPEPKPGVIPKDKNPHPRFFVQRHHASHLHYDFRLEIDGTLKSWAIPKGPTLDPGVKHFAAMVEDHPLDYGNFEGNIPMGNYGGGSVMLWDRGTFEMLYDLPADQQLFRGDFKFRLHGEKLQGEFALVLMKGRGKGNEWLLIKKKDEAARPGWDVEAHARSILTGRTQEEIAKELPPVKVAKPEAKAKPKAVKPAKSPAAGAVEAPMLTTLTPMGASLVKELPVGDQWKVEIKWDGVRAICFVDDGELSIITRNGNRCERQYPELSVLPRYVKAQLAVFDGEIAVLNEHGVASFELIQPRIMNSSPASIAHMSRQNPVRLFLFDLLYLDGYDLRDVPFAERRKLLEAILDPKDPVILSTLFDNSPELLTVAREHGLEGLVAKCLTSTYQSRRSADWLKWKIVSQQEFVLCGYTPGERDYFGSLMAGFYEKGKLVYAGNVGTGFDQKMIKSLYDTMQPLVTSESPFAEKPPKLPKGSVFLRPELVFEVKFAHFTRENILRAPVFVGLRTDKEPEACVREVPKAPNQVKSDPARRKPVKKRSVPHSGELLPQGIKEQLVTVDGHELKLTNLPKVFYPKDGYTKRDLLNYYDRVAPLILPHLKDRPLSLKRYPNGIDHPFFFQKNSPEDFPSWLRFEMVDDIRYVFAEDRASLLYLTNLGCIDQNPYQSRFETIHNPDWILIDLDPVECPFEMIIEAALLVREVLEEVGLRGYPKMTGGDGMHVYVPVKPVYTYEQSRQFAEVISRIVVKRRPEMFTTPRSVSKRDKGRVYFDYLQNGEGKTIAAPYVPRAYDHAPVATPLQWDEVKAGLTPQQFTIRNAPERFEKTGDLFADVRKKPQKLEAAFKKLAKLVEML
jgi:bifunctional non-homologous end joining protein LigD